MKLILLCFLINTGEGIMFLLIPNTVRCFREYVSKDIILIGEFNVTQIKGQEIDYIVTDSKQEILARNENIKNGRFSVVTENNEIYEICFRSRAISQLSGHSHTVSLHIMKGIEVDNKLAEEERTVVASNEIGLKRLKTIAASIVDDFILLNENEKKMRNTNESTNTRVVVIGIFSITWLLFTSGGQLYYLYNYFKSRKIIE
ncbi:hypothetical protein O3M35_010309 [Rhynocoris fuscipes]|uniref:GOLD domain-containing protein n=1 Tax=Rhynocoris fuscipes TaxID=488301 RepID=A0AAW1D666_9HEMI